MIKIETRKRFKNEKWIVLEPKLYYFCFFSLSVEWSEEKENNMRIKYNLIGDKGKETVREVYC